MGVGLRIKEVYRRPIQETRPRKEKLAPVICLLAREVRYARSWSLF
jgi:hypothetical protein